MEIPSEVAVTNVTVATAAEAQQQKPPLPPMTVGTSAEYKQKCALIASHATLDDPGTLSFNREKGAFKPGATAEEMREIIYQGNLVRLDQKGEKGGFIAEAGDWSAVASWIPATYAQPVVTEQDISAIRDSGRVKFAAMTTKWEAIRAKYLYPKYGHHYWHLSLLARNPQARHVPGAVRAVLEPFIKQAKSEGRAIWLIAANPHARDVYLHFGWKILDTIEVDDITNWGMLLAPDAADT